jgi:hypothetical protein
MLLSFIHAKYISMELIKYSFCSTGSPINHFNLTDSLEMFADGFDAMRLNKIVYTRRQHLLRFKIPYMRNSSHTDR